MKIKYLLQKLIEHFPMTDMREGFKGTHAITLTPTGQMAVNIWSRDNCWPIYLDANDEAKLETEIGVLELIEAMKVYIAEYKLESK